MDIKIKTIINQRPQRIDEYTDQIEDESGIIYTPYKDEETQVTPKLRGLSGAKQDEQGNGSGSRVPIVRIDSGTSVIGEKSGHFSRATRLNAHTEDTMSLQKFLANEQEEIKTLHLATGVETRNDKISDHPRKGLNKTAVSHIFSNPCQNDLDKSFYERQTTIKEELKACLLKQIEEKKGYIILI